MQRYIHPSAPKSDEILQAEKAAAEALNAYFDSGYGVQAMMVRDTGIPAPVLTKMRKPGNYPISLEHAMLMEMASNGELTAELLCPARAELLARFLNTRAKKTA